MTARDAALREITSSFPALASSKGDFSFVVYVLPYAPKEQMQTVQLIAGCRKDAWKEGKEWEAIPIDDFQNEPLLGLVEQLRRTHSDARLPVSHEEHNAVLVLNDII